MRELTQAGSAPAQAAAPTAAEMARIDAQLELAAKKAALAGMERAAQGGDATAPAAPPPPGEGVTVITVDQDGRTTTLTNPSAEQLAQAGVGTAPAPMPNGNLIVTLTVASLTAIVLVVWMVLNYLKRGRGSAPSRADQETAARMARIENAVESIAVEVERISEGQRYTSRMLSEGAAEPVRVEAPAHAGVVLQNQGGL
ncbi:MAG: hypothetical protein IT355_12235 [Gemmatimonadaceae bacterium]|nr:hypothetical protein [Gemmatimonadaceae bacterium]